MLGFYHANDMKNSMWYEYGSLQYERSMIQIVQGTNIRWYKKYCDCDIYMHPLAMQLTNFLFVWCEWKCSNNSRSRSKQNEI